jgi:GntR family transcriptional regulator
MRTVHSEIIVNLRIDMTSSIPAYRQIVDGLRVLLVSGQLKSDTALPSVRRMALDLGVHFNTVAEAYRSLADEGWLDLKHGRSALVIERTTPPTDNQKLQDLAQQFRSLAAQMRAHGVPVNRIRTELLAVAEEILS